MCHNPVFCVTPPHILKHIAEAGDSDKKHWALATLEAGSRIRGQREILQRYNLAKGPGMMGGASKSKFRVIQSAENRQNLIGDVVRREGQGDTEDKSVDEAYENTGDVYDFYMDAYGRNSIDGVGGKIISTVHFGKNFNNAFWNGERMVFGDGDGEVFNRFTKCLEVIGHELTHGVTNTAVQLEYQDQPGALNEAISDVFGCLSLQKKYNQKAAQADWVIGVGLLNRSVEGVGIRSLKAPGTAYDDKTLGKDPCPDNMRDYVQTNDDNGGIHINCSIPSHAFYLSAVELGGHAWEKLGQVWYNTVTRRMRDPAIKFEEFADLTLKVSNKLYGEGAVTSAVTYGWKKTGVI